jgi:hypothetical protein
MFFLIGYGPEFHEFLLHPLQHQRTVRGRMGHRRSLGHPSGCATPGASGSCITGMTGATWGCCTRGGSTGAATAGCTGGRGAGIGATTGSPKFASGCSTGPG